MSEVILSLLINIHPLMTRKGIFRVFNLFILKKRRRVSWRTKKVMNIFSTIEENVINIFSTPTLFDEKVLITP